MKLNWILQNKAAADWLAHYLLYINTKKKGLTLVYLLGHTKF